MVAKVYTKFAKVRKAAAMTKSLRLGSKAGPITGKFGDTAELITKVAQGMIGGANFTLAGYYAYVEGDWLKSAERILAGSGDLSIFLFTDKGLLFVPLSAKGRCSDEIIEKTEKEVASRVVKDEAGEQLNTNSVAEQIACVPKRNPDKLFSLSEFEEYRSKYPPLNALTYQIEGQVWGVPSDDVTYQLFEGSRQIALTRSDVNTILKFQKDPRIQTDLIVNTHNKLLDLNVNTALKGYRVPEYVKISDDIYMVDFIDGTHYPLTGGADFAVDIPFEFIEKTSEFNADGIEHFKKIFPWKNFRSKDGYDKTFFHIGHDQTGRPVAAWFDRHTAFIEAPDKTAVASDSLYIFGLDDVLATDTIALGSNTPLLERWLQETQLATLCEMSAP